MSTCSEQDNSAIRAEIAELRVRDPLTGLYNRGHFYRFASAALKKHRKGAAQALLYIRPDHFSGIDERFGPLASDALLKDLGDIINARSGRNTIVSRFGGNVFAVLLVRRSMFDIRELADNLLEEVGSTNFSVDKLTTQLTLSIGLVELTPRITDPAQAFTQAQRAARAAKEQGGNSVHIDSTTKEDPSIRDKDRGWVRKILSALVEDRFQLAFQPIAGLMGTGENINDVLVRMLDARGEEILPGDFMPAAEQAGLMPDIDKWVISKTLSLATEHQADKLRVFIVRISEPSLLDAGFDAWLESEFSQHLLTQAKIVFQVTEKTAEHHLPLIKSLSQRCRRMGCGLAIGHFGVSTSCLKLLQELTPEYLMIHGCYMEELEDPNRRLRLEQIVSEATERVISTVATRVEDARTLSTLCQIGIDYIQGYHLQQPENDIFDDIALPN